MNSKAFQDRKQKWIDICIARSCIEYPKIETNLDRANEISLFAHETAWFTSPEFGTLLIWSDD